MGPSDPGRRRTPRLDRALAAGPPLELTDWSLSPAGLELVLRAIGGGCRAAIECGCGVSTIVLARGFAELGEGTVHALEHDPGWAGLTRRRIAAEGLGAHARVVDAPLRPDPVAPPGCEWYERAALAELPSAGVDLMLVDGPPAGEAPRERARYPALPALADRLAAGAVVIVDDAERPGERWMLEHWREELGFEFERNRGARAAIGVISRTRGGTVPAAAESAGCD